MYPGLTIDQTVMQHAAAQSIHGTLSVDDCWTEFMLLPDLVVPYYANHKRNFNRYNSLKAMHLKLLYIFGFYLAFYQESCLKPFPFFSSVAK